MVAIKWTFRWLYFSSEDLSDYKLMTTAALRSTSGFHPDG